MNLESSENNKRNNTGIILALFILLVLVTRVFYAPSPQAPSSGQPGDGSSSITASQRFTINNQTSNYWIKPIWFAGEGFKNGLPVMRTISPEGSYGFEILWSFSRVYTATVAYEINRRDGSNAGSLQTTMYTNSPFDVVFQNTAISGPFTQTSSGTTLNVSAV
ncbi:hypothetical protein M3223_02585 [Paenibacillus pasadenensis]|uniref:hypothetical protein n=1 Tax=Paenibacillus pasadenensis TaxID=217090 RepID=UPI00203B189E|nr:hypothetical protein [Paenibacillus pasadenensis]MCM3746236.1 hypothetical protein [Paenibacillus pasadenensis]